MSQKPDLNQPSYDQAMIKGFIILIVGLVSVDMALYHGVGTATTLMFCGRAVHAFTGSISDSIFSR
jgi:hypothetical protein